MHYARLHLSNFVWSFAAAAVLAAGMSGCEPAEEAKKPPDAPMVLEQVAIADLPGWRDDDLSAALPALRQSCAALSKGPLTDKIGTPFVPMTVADWAPACAAIAGDVTSDPERLRALLESQFVALRVSHPPAQEGLFTGYFEPELAGARQRSTTYRYPLFRRPEDLVSIDLGSFQPELNGKRLMGRVDKGKLVPYFPRGAIDAGALSGRDLELLWLKDPIDSFLLHVQGSGRVVLPNGEVVRIGFAAHNGHGYVSIGRALIERGALERHEASWDGIRGWIERNPDQRDSLLAVNPRFIFFREIDGDGPIGSQGVPLTPGRSLAVDPAFVPLGVPLWLDTTWPGEEDQPLRRLVVAQDTGGAIKGPVRGDLFWGYGDSALAIAGRMKSRGTFFFAGAATDGHPSRAGGICRFLVLNGCQGRHSPPSLVEIKREEPCPLRRRKSVCS